jgi:predicted amidohydrolase YtcJ
MWGKPDHCADVGGWRRSILWTISFGAIATAWLPSAPAAGAERADLVVHHATVYTLDRQDQTAQAVAITKGTIVFVGSDEGAAAFIGKNTRVIDATGRTVMPGLADTHIHPALSEFYLRHLCDVRAFSLEEGKQRVRQCAKEAPPGEWVIGYGWYDVDAAGFDNLTNKDLDELVKERKLVIVAKDMHTMWLNSAAMREFNITRDRATKGGENFMTDPATGEPTGRIIDFAEAPVLQKIMHDSSYARKVTDLLQDAQKQLNAWGITTILDALVDEETLEAYHQLDAKKKLTMRVSVAPLVIPSNFRSAIPAIAAKRKDWQSEHVRLDFIKVVGDGNPEVGFTSFLNHGGTSAPASPGYYTDSEARELVSLAEANDLSIFVHIIGDGAARQMLDAVESARKGSPDTERRHTLTHLCWVDEADLPRFKQLHVLANIQEGWLAPRAFGGAPGYDYARASAQSNGQLGPWVAGRLFPYGPLVRAGAFIAGGTDWFYTDGRPWYAMEAGVTSKEPGGDSQVAMLPEHAIPLKELVISRTRNAAYQVYRENETGTLEPGKAADVIILDRDPLKQPIEKIHETQVLTTIFGGKVVWEMNKAVSK